jgi:hypothetical protein
MRITANINRGLRVPKSKPRTETGCSLRSAVKELCLPGCCATSCDKRVTGIPGHGPISRNCFIMKMKRLTLDSATLTNALRCVLIPTAPLGPINKETPDETFDRNSLAFLVFFTFSRTFQGLWIVYRIAVLTEKEGNWVGNIGVVACHREEALSAFSCPVVRLLLPCNIRQKIKSLWNLL